MLWVLNWKGCERKEYIFQGNTRILVLLYHDMDNHIKSRLTNQFSQASHVWQMDTYVRIQNNGRLIRRLTHARVSFGDGKHELLCSKHPGWISLFSEYPIFFQWGKVTGSISTALTSIKCPHYKWVAQYLCSPICLYGVLLFLSSFFSSSTSSPLNWIELLLQTWWFLYHKNWLYQGPWNFYQFKILLSSSCALRILSVCQSSWVAFILVHTPSQPSVIQNALFCHH